MKAGLSFGIAIVLVPLTVTSAVISPGFEESSIPLPTFADITDIEWAPDSSQRLFLVRKAGEVYVLEGGALPPVRILRIDPPVFDYIECGLLSMCFDPNFVQNGYFYLFASTSTSEQKIFRYELRGNTAANKVELITGLPSSGLIHVGGGLGMGHDGRLYWSIGDLGGVGVDNDLTSLASKVGRANLDGTIPVLNPFRDGTGPNHELIWARGFRNPFKMTFQPATGWLWLNVAGNVYETVFVVHRADHGGWNDYETDQPAGYIAPKIKYRTNGSDSRSLVAGSGAVRQNNIVTFTTTSPHHFIKGEHVTITGVANASFNGSVYVRDVTGLWTFTAAQTGSNASSGSGTATTLALGGAVTGGCFYNGTAFPAEYHGNYFFCDFNSHRVNRALLNSSNQVIAVDYFVSGITSAVDVATGPDGALYYTGFSAQRLYRLAYTNGPQNLVVSPANLLMAEGGTAATQVRLAATPAAPINVAINHISGNGITTTNTSLTFTPANSAIPQAVYFSAALDGNAIGSKSVFRVMADSLPTVEITVTAYDAHAGEIRCTSVSRSKSITRLEVLAESRVNLLVEGSADLRVWNTITNATTEGASIIVFDSVPTSHRFYRASAP